MHSPTAPTPALPRLVMLGSAITAAALLVAAPFVLPHASAAEPSSATHYATPTMSSDTHRSDGYRPKPSPAHRLSHPLVVKHTAPKSDAPLESTPADSTDTAGN